MWMPLLTSSPCVGNHEYSWFYICLTTDFQYYISCNTAYRCQQLPVVEHQRPVLAGHMAPQRLCLVKKIM